MTAKETTEGRSVRARAGGYGHPRVLPLVFGVSVIFFVAGCAAAAFRSFPYPQLIEPGFMAARAVCSRLTITSSLHQTDLWKAPRFEQRGVVRRTPEKECAGLTLYTSGHDSAAFLIDMDGLVLHEWRVPFYAIWSQPPHVAHPVSEPFIYWRRAHLFPNGDLIALYEAAGDTPWGYGLLKVDRDSNVIWKVAEHAHHDLCVRPDQCIVTLSHEWRDLHRDSVTGMTHLGQTLLDDHVLVLSPEGQVIQRISVLDAFADSEYENLFASVAEDEWDLLHTNTVELITPEFARHHDFARPGQVMLSLRSRHALAILDLESRRIVWAQRGPYFAQHDPDVLPNGNILLFDNQGHVGPGGPSRVLEIDPTSQEVHWCYVGSEANPLYSQIRSAQQRLPNGNTLISESDGGRILEVTKDHEVVWEFRNPARLPDGKPSIAIVCGATRVPTGQLKFELNKGVKQRAQ